MIRDLQANDPSAACAICSTLGDVETAFQKYGWEERNTHLPTAADRLTLLQDCAPASSRVRQLKRCPLCGTLYLYLSDYEYLVNGSEDEQTLRRLTTDQAREYLATPTEEA